MRFTTICATWNNRTGVDRLKELVTNSYKIDKNDVDESKDILKEIGQLVDMSVEYNEQDDSGTTSNEAEIADITEEDVLMIASSDED